MGAAIEWAFANGLRDDAAHHVNFHDRLGLLAEQKVDVDGDTLAKATEAGLAVAWALDHGWPAGGSDPPAH
jgi:hypothetical protein